MKIFILLYCFIVLLYNTIINSDMVKIFNLKNGIKCIYEKINHLNSLTITLLFKVGSINELNGQFGISHLLEHLFFQGNEKFKDNYEIGSYINNFGGIINAATLYDMTYYYITIDNSKFEEALYLLSSIMYSPTFDDLDMQKDVVINELNRMRNVPNRLAMELFYSTALKKTDYEHSIGGIDENIKNISYDDILHYLNRFYDADNALISIVGNLSYNTVKKLLNIYFPKNFRYDYIGNNVGTGKNIIKNTNQYQKFKQTSSVIQYPINNVSYDFLIDNQYGYRYTNHVMKGISLCYVVLGFPIVALTDNLYYPCFLLHSILGANMSSRLYNVIRQKYGYTYSIRTMIDNFKDFSLFVISYTVEYKNAKKSIDLVLGELDNLKKEKVSEDELKRGKNYLIGYDKIKFTGSDTIAIENMYNLCYMNKYLSKKEYYKGINDVKVSDVLKTAKRIFDNNLLNLTVVGPKALKL